MLRRHQQALRDYLFRSSRAQIAAKKQLVVHVWPGGGKSALPVIAANELSKKGLIDKTVIVVPRLTLKHQGECAFQERWLTKTIGHNLKIHAAENVPPLDRGTNGYITTYDSIRTDPRLHLDYFRRFRCLLCLDEVHHVGSDSPTNSALEPIHNSAAFRLLLTGTIDRREGDRIGFLDYAARDIGENLRPDVDISYGLRDAITEKAVIQMEFLHIDGKVAFVNRDGDRVSLGTLNDSFQENRDGLMAALETEYAVHLLQTCVNHWRSWRAIHPRSLLLVVCMNIEQAKSINKVLSDMRVNSAIATSENTSEAQETILRFRRSGQPEALVTVAMAYEGMDVKPITHIACLTHIRSAPWLMQMFGRATRFDPDAGSWESQRAFIVAPDDPDMQSAINYVREEQSIGIQAIDFERDDDQNRVEKDRKPVDLTGIVPLAGEMTRARASGLFAEGDLSYSETSLIQEKMNAHNIIGSITDMAALLKDFGLGVPESEEDDFQTGPECTSSEAIKKLRLKIHKKLGRMDRFTKSDPGTWNRKCYGEAQNFRARESLNESELARVWKWCNDQAMRLGMESEQ